MTATIARPRQPHSDWLARLRTIMVLRPGQRVVHLPGIGVSVSRRAVSSGGELVLQPNEGDAVDTYLTSSTEVAKTRNYGVSAILGEGGWTWLFRWDLTSASGSIISATLSLWTAATKTTNRFGNIYQLTSANADFPEGNKNAAVGGAGDCCYNYKNQTPGSETNWAGGVGSGCKVAGTDYINTALATGNYTANAPTGTQIDFAFNADGLSALESCFGSTFSMAIFETASSLPSVHSSSSATPSYRPRLTIAYQ